MTSHHRWDYCISHRAEEARAFVAEYFAQGDRQVFLIGGAGFDPRSPVVCKLLAKAVGPELRALFIREERPNPDRTLLERANQIAKVLADTVPNSETVPISVFATDGAVIGGREVVRLLQQRPLDAVTDIVVDISALSIGLFFPVIRHLLDTCTAHRATNLHIFVPDNSFTDSQIIPTASDRVGTIAGFQGGLGLDSSVKAVKLWLPQLTHGKRAILDRIYGFVNPDDVCPILPFPAADPRLPDELIDHYRQQLESAWEVDARNIVYAHERNPLDLYRTVSRLDAARKRVFKSLGGSLVVLSPSGSKAFAMGALMAAVERDLPVVYVEPIGYQVNFDKLDSSLDTGGDLIHLWLHGDAYAQNGGRK